MNWIVKCIAVQFVLLLSTAQAQEIKQPAKPAPAVALAKEKITSVGFSGYQAGNASILLALPEVSALIGKPVNDEEALKTATRAVADYYRSIGFLVANAAISKVEKGEIEIVVYEGLMDAVKIDNKSNVQSDALLRYAVRALCQDNAVACAGQPLLSGNSERMVGIISDLPGTSGTQLTLAPGAQAGTTQPTLHVDKGDAWTAYVSVDNYGGQFTGKNRLTAGVLGNNWLGIGDQFIAEIASTDQKDNLTGQLGYSLPVGYSGWRIGANYSRNQYLLGDVFEVLDSKGRSDTVSLYGTYPIIRSQDNNMYFRASYDYGQSENYVLKVKQPAAKTQGINLSLNGRLIDHWFGRSFSAYGVSFYEGRITPKDSGYVGITGSYNKLTWNVNRDQELYLPGASDRISLYGALRGQQTQETLDGSQRIALGGPSGVRAYPGGEATGDEGQVLNLELRYGLYLAPVLPGFLTLAVFHDHGWKKNKDNIGNSNKTLYGNGVSLNLSVSDRYSIAIAWAQKGSGSPEATGETSPKNSRFWVSGAINF